MHRLLYLVFFFSGAAALIFESLWFNLASLVVGNSVVASSLVLASFMGGLAIGNALIGRFGDRLTAPLRTYAWLEIVVAGVGLALVLGFPALNGALTPAFRQAFDHPWLLNGLRFSSSFVLLLLPSAAMGATLPVMVKGLGGLAGNFGATLGVLYGLNTLGAVAGVVICEWYLIGQFGVRGSGWIAAGVDLIAAAAAFLLSKSASRPKRTETASAPTQARRLSPYARRLLLAAFLSGASLLALEVIWFRFLLLFLFGSSANFALMLATVLVGIAAGGLFASRMRAHQALPFAALLAGAFLILSYRFFTAESLGFIAEPTNGSGAAIWAAVRLMLPVAVCSGMLFTITGQALYRELAEPSSESKVAGFLTVANTTGAMAGALLAGFVLLPGLGIDLSLFVIAITYLIVAILCVRTRGFTRFVGAATVYGLLLGFFPFHQLRNDVFPRVLAKFAPSEVVEVREGVLQTIFYLRREQFGEPLEYRLVTDNYSMSGTQARSRRYMKFFVYLPVALHPNPKKALLISYGVGSTAKALTDTRSLTQIDVVDISSDIVAMNSIVYPAPGALPADDPRVRVMIEDGRFYLQTTDQKYDLITGEPPPPKAAGIHRLYSKEYFQLLYDRLEDGGMATYWLPMYQLDQSDSRAIVRAFCEVFEECSLWTGAGLEWVLFGGRNVSERVDDDRFSAQWRDEVVRRELVELGFEGPQDLGALFIDDAAGLSKLYADTPPLVDAFPHRVSPYQTGNLESAYGSLMEIEPARRRFDGSAHIRRLWPDEMRRQSLPEFENRHRLNNVMRFSDATITGPREYDYRVLFELLSQSTLKTLPLWWLGSSAREQEIVHRLTAQERRDPKAELALAAGAMAERDFATAASLYGSVYGKSRNTEALKLEILALGLAGDRERAQERMARLEDADRKDRRDVQYLEFLTELGVRSHIPTSEPTARP